MMVDSWVLLKVCLKVEQWAESWVVQMAENLVGVLVEKSVDD